MSKLSTYFIFLFFIVFGCNTASVETRFEKVENSGIGFSNDIKEFFKNKKINDSNNSIQNDIKKHKKHKNQKISS